MWKVIQQGGPKCRKPHASRQASRQEQAARSRQQAATAATATADAVAPAAFAVATAAIRQGHDFEEAPVIKPLSEYQP